METSTHTGTRSHIAYYEDGQQVFPCRCGETHRGDFALEDYRHHECDHTGGFWAFLANDWTGGLLLLCSDCGAGFFKAEKPKVF